MESIPRSFSYYLRLHWVLDSCRRNYRGGGNTRNSLRIALQSGHLLASMAQGLAADVIYVLKAGREASLGLTGDNMVSVLRLVD